MAGSRGRKKTVPKSRLGEATSSGEAAPDGEQDETMGARLSFRVDPSIKSLIERAAQYSGETVTSYALSTLVRDAREVVQAHEVTVLSDRARDEFLAMLDNPPEPNTALLRAAQRYRELAVPREPKHKRA